MPYSRLFLLGCQIDAGNFCINILMLFQTLLVQVSYGKVLVLFVITCVLNIL